MEFRCEFCDSSIPSSQAWVQTACPRCGRANSVLNLSAVGPDHRPALVVRMVPGLLKGFAVALYASQLVRALVKLAIGR